uniref:Uncharacterized protein n=1 Tax=Dendroctonus ponderosae TaxID=77166 RepID=A0AAR5PYI4_DENPD
MAPKTAMERLQQENEELRKDIRSAAVKGAPKPSAPRKTAAPKTVQVSPKKPAPHSPQRRRDESEGEEETIIIEVTGMETDSPVPERVEKIPPINIQGQTSWRQLNGAFTAEGIEVTRAATNRNGVAVTTKTAADFRKATSLLQKPQRPYYTYTQPEDKKLHVVIRGLPQDIEASETEKELGIKDAEAFQMVSRRTKERLSLVLKENNFQQNYGMMMGKRGYFK